MKEALALQQRVISALIYRELKTRFGRTKLGVVWLFMEPLAHLLVLAGFWALMGRSGAMGIPAPLFLISGIVPYLFFRTSVMRMISAVSANKTLLVFWQIKIYDLIIARLLIEIVVYIVVFATSLSVIALLDYPVQIQNPGGWLLSSAVLWMAALSTALLFLPIVATFPIVERFLRIGFRVLYVCSGLMYGHHALPYEWRQYLLANPFFHIIQTIRHSMFVELPFDPETMDLRYVGFVFGLLFLIGAGLMRRLRVQVLADQ